MTRIRRQQSLMAYLGWPYAPEVARMHLTRMLRYERLIRHYQEIGIETTSIPKQEALGEPSSIDGPEGHPKSTSTDIG